MEEENYQHSSNTNCLPLKSGEQDKLFHEFDVITSSVTKETSLSQYLTPIENTIVKYLNNDEEVSDWCEESLDYFLKKIVPSITNTLCKREKHLLLSVVERISVFLKNVIKLVIHCLEFKWVEHLELLSSLFNSDSEFYSYTSVNELSSEKGKTYEFAGFKEDQYWNISKYLLENINTFGCDGGFAKILKILETMTLDIQEVRLITTYLAKISDFLSKNFILEFAPEVATRMKDFLYLLSDEQIKAFDPVNIQEVVNNTRNFYNSLNEAKSNEIFENLSLTLTLKYFKSPYLTVRLAGVNEIKNFICIVESKKQIQLNFARADHSKQSWITANYLVKWIRENNIMEQLYKENSHLELIRRCVEIPIFLAKEIDLSESDIDLIWKGVAKHEALAVCIYTSLSTLTSFLELSKINYLFELIKKVPLQNLDLQLIQLLRTVTQIGIPYTQEVPQFYGLDLMWEVVQDDVVVNYQIKDAAMKFIEEFIYWKDCYAYRVPLILKIIDNLKAHKSSCSSMKVLQKVLNSYPELSTATESVITILQWLEAEHNLVTLLLNDLEHYNVIVEKHLEENNFTRNHPEYWNTTSFVGTTSHLREITDRLDFLTFVLKKSMITLSQEHIDTIWRCVIKQGITKEVREVGLKWFNNTIRDTTEVEPFVDVALYIFEHKFRELDLPNLSTEGLDLIYSFFKYINLKSEMLQTDPLEYHEFVVCSPDLTGISFLQEIILTVNSFDVAKQAINILLDLQTNLSSDLAQYTKYQRESFIKFCMNQMSDCVKQGVVEAENYLRIYRCLIMLKSLIDKFDPITTTRHGSIAKNGMITVNIQPAFTKTTFKLEIFKTDTVGELKDKVAQALHLELGTVRLTTAGRELAIDQKTVENVGITNGQSIIALTRKFRSAGSAPSLLATRSAVDENAPSSILSSQYFDQLFELLSLNDDNVGERVWDLLMLLPTNEQILNQLQTSDSSPDWDNIFTAQSLYRLLYLLQIVESNVNTTGSSGDQLLTKLNWKSWFLSAGGVSHLIKLFIQNQLHKSSRAKSKYCVGLILLIISSFKSDLIAIILEYDPPSIVNQVLEVIEIISLESSASTNSENDKIIRYSLEFLELCCAHNRFLFAIVSYPRFNEWIYNILILCLNGKTRELIGNFFTTLYEKYTSVNDIIILDFLYHSLHSFLHRIESDCNTSDHYFELLNNTIQSILYDRELSRKYESNFKTILSQLVQSLIDHPIVESGESNKEDTVLIGILKVICTLICVHRGFKDLFGPTIVDQLFNKCLFEFPTLESPRSPVTKCKSRQSRMIAFEVLYEITEYHAANLQNLALKLLTNHCRYAKNVWQYCPSKLEKSHCGYVGLRNLGSTCYMNSLMQQFYMVPNFRQGFFALPTVNKSNDNDGDQISGEEDNLLYQMKKLFGNLQESQKKYFNTAEFCSSYKDNGQSVNPSIQMDVDEFFNMLLEKLENSIKGSAYESFFKDFFGGKVCNQVISKDCSHVSENYEDFNTISVAVKGKNSLEESLALFVESDFLEGDNKYECSKCNNAKVDALKRCCIESLPNNLIIHMRRFEFDIEEMRRMKVNDHCRFPIYLDMEPYTKEGLEKKEAEKAGKPPPDHRRSYYYYQYQLVGIIVHHGTAEFGHYYSFIKDRDTSLWYQFNDKLVDYFDERDISNNCFGGLERISQYDENMRKVQHYIDKEESAYMLFYQRTKPFPTSSDTLGSTQSIPPSIYTSIWKDNIQFFIDKYLFDTNYFSFVEKMIRNASFEPELSYSKPLDPTSPSFLIIELGTRVFTQTLTHAQEKDILGSFLEALKEKYTTNLAACKWFISTCIKESWAKQFLVTCPIEDAREAFCGLIIHVLHCLSSVEEPFFEEEISDHDFSYYIPRDCQNVEITSTDEFEESSSEIESFEDLIFIEHLPSLIIPKAFSIWFIEHAITLLKYLRHSWRNLKQYFKVFACFAREGRKQKRYLLSRSIIARFIDFYIGDESPLAIDLNVNRQKIGDKFKKPELSDMIDLIATLLCSANYKSRATNQNNPPQSSSSSSSSADRAVNNNDDNNGKDNNNDGDENGNRIRLEVGALDREFLQTDAFYRRLLTDVINPKASAIILSQIMQNDEGSSKAILTTIYNNLFNHSNDIDLQPFFDLITEIFKIQDRYQEWRTNELLLLLIQLTENWGSKLAMETYHIVRYLSSIAHLPLINQWLYSNITTWICKWLIINRLDQVRIAASSLLQKLLTISEVTNEDGMTEVTIDRDRRIQVFELLLQYALTCMLHTNRETYEIQLQSPSSNHSEYDMSSSAAVMEEGYTFESSSWKLVEYFKFLKWCIVSSDDRELFFEYYDDYFLPLFTKIDLNNFDMDENKAQLTHLLFHIVEDDSFCSNLLATKESTTRLLAYYISLKQAVQEEHYNNHVLSVFFKLIYRCCNHDSNFLSAFLHHSNFSWNFAYLYMAAEYPLVSNVFYEIMMLTKEIESYRHLQLHLHIHHKDRAKFSLKNVFRSLNLLLTSQADCIYFCNEGALEYFSSISDLQADDLDFDPEAVVIVENTLSFIVKITDWFGDATQSSSSSSSSPPSSSSPSLSNVDRHWVNAIYRIVRNFVETSLIDTILSYSYRIIYNFAMYDRHMLKKIVRFLFVEHENYYLKRFENRNDAEFVHGPRRPTIKAHLTAFSENEFITQHEEYYSFLNRLCYYAIQKLIQSAKKMKNEEEEGGEEEEEEEEAMIEDQRLVRRILELYVFTIIETASLPSIHTSLLSLLEMVLDSPICDKIISDSRIDTYIVRALTIDIHLLELEESYNIIHRLFPEFCNRIQPSERFSILQLYEPLLDTLHEVLRSQQNTESVATKLTQFLKAARLFFGVDLFNQVTGNQKFTEICEMLSSGEVSFPNLPNNALEELQSALLDLISEM